MLDNEDREELQSVIDSPKLRGVVVIALYDDEQKSFQSGVFGDVGYLEKLGALASLQHDFCVEAYDLTNYFPDLN